MRYSLCIALALVAAFAFTLSVNAADNVAYRTVGTNQYQIIEARGIYLYTLDTIVRKGALEKTWFFSVGPDGDVRPLTILNLKTAFPNSHAFHDLLDMTFKHDSDLTRYDEFHKTFKVNRLLDASKER